MWCVNKHSFTLFFLICMHYFILFHFIALLHWLGSSVKCWIEVIRRVIFALLSVLGQKHLVFHYYALCRVFIGTSYYFEEISFYLEFILLWMGIKICQNFIRCGILIKVFTSMIIRDIVLNFFFSWIIFVWFWY